jgi:DNA-binding MarR family transcriptional regulator
VYITLKSVKTDPPAVRLAVAIKRLRARLQEAASASTMGLPIAQLAILKRLRDGGPTTAASLASAEHVTQQAIAQQLVALKHASLIRATADPADKRKSVIRITAAGQRLFESAIASRNAWLARAIDATIAASERPALDKAIALLERLAAASPGDRVPSVR